jgi:hypothetical protein
MMEDIVSFFHRVTKLEPTKDQQRLLLTLIDPLIKRIAISAGRQTGKTLCCAVAATYLSIYRPNTRIILTSVQDNWLYDHMTHIWDNNPDLEVNVKKEDIELTGQVVIDSKKKGKKGMIRGQGVKHFIPMTGYETTVGTAVYVRASTEKALRGVGGDIAFVDEAAEMTDDTITTVMGNISGDYAKIVLLSTPHKTGKFTEIIENPEEYGFVLFKWSEEGLSWHTPEELASKKKMFSSQKYKTDVLGEPLNREERAYFPTKHIEKCIMEVSTDKEGGPVSRVEVGLDFGYNACTLIATERIGTVKRKVIFVKQWEHKTKEEISDEILSHIAKLAPFLTKADAMPAEYKDYYSRKAPHKFQYIRAGMHDASHNGEWSTHKEQMLGQLGRKIREHSMIIPQQFVDLIKELKGYRRGMTVGDDFVDALALSIYEPVEPLDTGLHGGIYFPKKKYKGSM